MPRHNLLLAVTLVTASAVLGFAQLAPTASASCAVNVGNCENGDCAVNLVASCTNGGDCIVNAALASCEKGVSSCEANVFATCHGGMCDANVVASCYGNFNNGFGNCDANVLSTCHAGGLCLVNVVFSDCYDGGQCTVNAVFADCRGGCPVNVFAGCENRASPLRDGNGTVDAPGPANGTPTLEQLFDSAVLEDP